MRVSVVMPSYRCERSIERALGALAGQTFRDFETVVVDSSPGEETERIVRAGFPDVRLERSERRLAVHEARNRGAELAVGELLVFTDPDCAARPDWLARLLAAHERERSMVGGAIAPASSGRRSRAIHRCKFGAWDAGQRPGDRHMLPTANLLMERAVWDEVGPFRVVGWSGDTELCWRARERGHRLVFEPAAVVEHRHKLSLAGFWRERLARGAAFGAVRSQAKDWSRARAAIALAATPLVPLVLSARTLHRDDLTTLPLQLVGHMAWALGEARAYLELLRG